MKKFGRIVIVAALAAVSAASGVWLSGCSKSSVASSDTPRIAYVDIQHVAERHPAWRQAATCGLVGGGLREQDGWNPPSDAYSVPRRGVGLASAESPEDKDTLAAIRSAADREIEAFEKAERAAAEPSVWQRECEILRQCDIETANAKHKCNDELRATLRAISQDYAAKALPLRLKVEMLKKNDDSYAELDGDFTIEHPGSAAKTGEMEKRLAALTANRDAAWAGALKSSESAIAKSRETARRKAEERIAGLRVEAEAAVSVKVAERRAAALISQGKEAKGTLWTASRAPTVTSNGHRPPVPRAADAQVRLSATAGDLVAERSRLRSIALHDARVFVSALAEAEGLEVVCDPSERGVIPDRTEEFVQQFSRRLATAWRGPV